MDQLSIKIEETVFEGQAIWLAHIFINDTPLKEIVKRHEENEIRSQDDKPLLGAYQSLELDILYEHLMEATFLGEAEILGCGSCGIDSCWPFTVDIEEKNGQIIWSNYRQPYRKQWKYKDLKPFIFDKKDYFDEVKKLEEY